jgi:hypothetical protein
MGKGSNNNGSANIQGVTVLSTSKIYLNYLELPFNLIYRTPLGQGSFYICGGVFTATCINGKTIGSVTFRAFGLKQTTTTNKTFVFGSDTTSDIKRLDYGFSGLMGYKMENGFFINLSYDVGLANILANPHEQPNVSSQAKTLSVSIYIRYEF